MGKWLAWILWRRWFRLSETTLAVLYMWENDAKNWRCGTHAIVHQKTGIAVWTANEEYGVSLYVEIPDRDRANCHPCGGQQVKLRKRDRRAIYRTIMQGQSIALNREIQRQVADWMTDNIPHHVDGRVTAAAYR